MFVTVGTHEQPFDRLMRATEQLVSSGKVNDIVIQYGYCAVQPTGCRNEMFFSYTEMLQLLTEADVVITHGGPSTFIEAMTYGKTPIVVPRQAVFGEHVNNHQVDFVRNFAERIGGIIPVYDTEYLSMAIDQATRAMEAPPIQSNNELFCKELRKLVKEL